jgi:catechol 2,3-dioxygenase-like lactoylglutathione lyase family enzyme
MEAPMNAEFDRLLNRYEKGELSRRELLAALTALVTVARTSASAEPDVGAVAQLNHVTVFVHDVQRSVDFYQRLFGMPVLTHQEPGVNLRVGSGFLGIYPAEAHPTGIDHVCFGLENYDADAILKKLADAGVNGSIRLRGDTKELYFMDADNVRVQLQDVRYRGGIGPLGDRDPK